MTTTARPVRRETLSSTRERGAVRPLIVELHSTFIRIKPKGMRTYFVATYAQIYMIGARNAAEELRRERAAAKVERDKARRAR
jgi:hypothetical protein